MADGVAVYGGQYIYIYIYMKNIIALVLSACSCP